VATFKPTAVMHFGILALILATQVHSADISPGKWPAAERERAEKQEAAGWAPAAARSISSKNGVISAIASPIAVQAGITVLREGGTAADAAGAVALTEITTQLGSVVSYAGIMTLVYYDAKTKKVYSLDAGYNSYRNETEPRTIPVADLGPLNSAVDAVRKKDGGGPMPAASKSKGRETLVPGFMAGIEAMHARFGRLPFAELFEPAIWYAERGVVVNPPLFGCFELRREFLARTPEGRQFLHQAGEGVPRLGDRFLQPELARTLRSVAKHGSRHMYTGQWAHDFIKTVEREGGKVTIDDMARYRVIWSEPLATTFEGHQVYTAGLSSHSAYNILPALNLAEELKLDKRSPYWQDPKALRDLQRISDVIDSAPQLDSKVASVLRGQGIDISPAAQLTKTYAKAVAPLLDQLVATAQNAPRHSNAVVVIDKEGSIAAITHTINSVIWGDTGIVVGGISIPDSAGFQQELLGTIKPGDRVPNEMMQTIVFQGDKPILATAAIGASMVPETVKLVVGVVGQGIDLKMIQAAPPLMYNFMLAQPGHSAVDRGLAIPEKAYAVDFEKKLGTLGMKVTKIPASTADGLRGTVVAVRIDPTNNMKETVETPDVLIFGGAE
jgi:gamma-glutamyltranspeptidase / glutathione hydrolase